MPVKFVLNAPPPSFSYDKSHGWSVGFSAAAEIGDVGMNTSFSFNQDGATRYSEELYYEDCGTAGCKPQYNGNISRMAHEMAVDGGKKRASDYVYDFMNRLTDVDDNEQDEFDEYFAYDAQGRITVQRRGADKEKLAGAGYVYISHTNKLLAVTPGGGGELDKRFPAVSYQHFKYDADGNMTNDNSKDMSIAYDWRGMPVEFKRFRCTTKGSTVCDSVKLVMAYDGSGRRISKTRMMKTAADGDWYVDNVTHYTGIGTEVRESYFGGALENAKVVVNMPQGLGRYTPEDAEKTALSTATLDENGRPTSWSVFNPKFEWYLKNHLGSTMLVYGTQWVDDENLVDVGAPLAAYDYRAFGEQVDLTEPTDKVTENFTGKEKDDETELNYFGARYLDPSLGLWISVDAARQYQNPYLYAGNNPIMRVDPDGNQDDLTSQVLGMFMNQTVKPQMETSNEMLWNGTMNTLKAEGTVAKYGLVAVSVFDPDPATRNMANGAIIALDALEGYFENGRVGAVTAASIDVLTLGFGKLIPDNVKNRLGQTIFSNAANAAASEMFNDHLTPAIFSDEIIQDNIVPADKTNVEW